jgi:hypothetical protein
MNESRRHGISWKPSSDYLVNIWTEHVKLTGRGIWHLLLETIINQPYDNKQSISFQIKDLLGLCPEIYDEFERTLGEDSKLIDLINPGIIVNSSDYEIWLRFSVSRKEIKNYRLSRHNFLQLIPNGNSIYYQVKSEDDNVLTFEFRNSKIFDKNINKGLFVILEKEIKELNVFSSLNKEGLSYSIPIQSNMPIILPQIMVLYSLIFWLGSIVRYDPHSVADLQDSEYWILIDGFINQSMVWLLELFEWEFYKWETTLQSAR